MAQSGRHHLSNREILERLRPIDDDFMRCLFMDDLPLAEHVLRIITGISDLVLEREETQRDLKRLVGARSVCLDVWGTDSQGTQYDLEIQRASAGARPRRARYHSAGMDIETLDAGDDFERLPETYVIFITEGDVFGAGLGTYPFERICVSAPEMPLGDGTHILYVNGAYRGDDEIGLLMRDFCQSDPERMKDEMLAVKSRYLKQSEEGASNMCELLEEMRNEMLEQGIEQGIEQGVLNSVSNIMRNLKLTAQQAMDVVGVPESERAHYLTML